MLQYFVLVSSIAQVIKIENCTSIKQKYMLERCEIHDVLVDFVFLVKEPLSSLFVSLKQVFGSTAKNKSLVLIKV